MSDSRGDILVDMDGVMADFDQRVELLIAERYPEITIIKPRSNFYLHRDYDNEDHDLIKGIWRAPGFYRELDVMAGAIHGWQVITENQFTPRICSSPIKQNPNCVAEKQAWLEEHLVPYFGYSVIDLAIFDRDKAAHDAVALIDDSPIVKGADTASWRHILFDAPYNQSIDSDLRLRGWLDPDLAQLLERAAA